MRIHTPAFLRRYILTLTALLVSVGFVSAQTERVIFSGTHITVGKAMSEIQEQTRYIFAFNRQFDTGVSVRLEQHELTVAEALDQIFADIPFKTMVHSRFIAISPDTATPARANPVARAMDNRLTNDRYRQNDLNALNNESTTYDNRPPVGRYETVRTVTVIPTEPVIRNYPASYSAYTSPTEYARQQVSLPKLAVKTNLLYGAAVLAPNLGIEFATAPRQTFELSGGYSWKGRTTAASDEHKQLAQLLVRAEYRWWTCERFNGHYFGTHAFYGGYYVSNRDIPLLFKKEHSYDGWAIGAGITYGYHWAVGKRIGLEFNIGVGYAYMDYERGTCSKCYPDPVQKTKHYFGPTRAGINLVFMIN